MDGEYPDSRSELYPTVISPLTAAYPDFRTWFRELRNELQPHYVVAIARGAVRVLQLLDVLDEDAPGRLISDQALPFLPSGDLHGAKVLLFDDSLVFGSTMAELYEYLVARGAQPTCAAYIVDAENFHGQTRRPDQGRDTSPHNWLPLRWKQLVYPDFIRSHHSALVEAVLRTPLGYNPDFLTYRITLPQFQPGDIPYLVSQLRNALSFRTISDVSLPEAPEHGVWRYTAFLQSIPENLFPKTNAILRPHSKVRISFIPGRGEIRLTPIVQLAIPASSEFDTIAFSQPLIHRAWKSLQPPADRADPFYHPALSRLLTAFMSLLVGEFFIRGLPSMLADKAPAVEAELLTDDQRFMLGEPNASRLAAARAFLNKNRHIGFDRATLPFPESAEEPNAPVLRDRLLEIWRSHPRIRPAPTDLATEAIAKVLLTLKGVTDSAKSRVSDSSAKRLRVGLSCESIRLLLDACGIRISLDSVSLAIDTCVDSGPAVPKIILEDGLWFRAFYSGEASDSDRCEQFKSALHAAYRDLRHHKGSRALSPYDFQKLCVCLRDLCPFLPVQTYLHTFGVCISVGSDRQDLIRWLTADDRTEIAPVVRSSAGKRDVLEPNAYYEPSMLPTWTAPQRREFREAFHFIGTAFQRLPDDAKLLWSTCRTHRDVYSAMAFEAYSWGERQNANLGFICRSLVGDLSIDREPRADVVEALYWIVQFLAEIRRKRRVFMAFPDLSTKLAKSF